VTESQFLASKAGQGHLPVQGLNQEYIEQNYDYHTFDTGARHSSTAGFDFTTEIGGIAPAVVSINNGGDHKISIMGLIIMRAFHLHKQLAK